MRMTYWAYSSLILLITSQALGGGFQLWEQDSSGIGDYHSSAAAEAINPGTQFYNPAGMTHLSGPALSTGVAYIPLSIDYQGTAGPLDTYTTANSSTDNFVPNLFLVYPFNSQFAFGFGVTVPFGSSTDYPVDNPLSDAATKTSLQTLNLNPSLAWAPNRYFSLALGFDALYAMADYDSAFYFAWHEIHTPETLNSLENNLTDWAYGWNGGLMLYPTEHFRFGLSYRSSLRLDGMGTSDYKDPIEPVSNPNLSGVIHLPATWIMGVYADISQQWSLLFSAFYTEWSDFNNLVLNNVQVIDDVSTISIHENYQNSWNLAFGAHVWVVPQFIQLKLGVGYDQTPTLVGYRDVRLPDSPKYSVSYGLHVDASKSCVVDFGWTHFFVEDAVVDNSKAMSDNVSMFTTTIGQTKTQVNVIGIQLSWKI
jgi:long-chain fatty acid transport protein